MTIKFSIRHHYKNIPITISVEAEDTKDLHNQMVSAVTWIMKSRWLIDLMYEETVKLTQKDEKP